MINYEDMTIFEKRILLAKIQHSLEKSLSFREEVLTLVQIEEDFGTFKGIDFYPQKRKENEQEKRDTDRA